MPPANNQEKSIVVAALYHFAYLPDYRDWQAPLLQRCRSHNVFGTLLLAEEGVNGTIAGQRADIDNVLGLLKSDSRTAGLVHKESYTDEMPFHRLKVRLKKEIVTMGVSDTDPNKIKGTYQNAEQWNALITDPDVLVIDTRNEYEVSIGSFRNAVSPHTQTFREFPEYVKNELADQKTRKIAMFCTGGIRCEKSTSYLKSQGFTNVYHLQGGILKYLETVKPEDNLWEGECFVFDDRVSVNKDLEPGAYEQCHACRRPLAKEDKASVHYRAGISCPYCIEEYDDERRARFAERQKQIKLARERGGKHLGHGISSKHSKPTSPPKMKSNDAGLPILYSFRRCPYAMRARLALAQAGINVELREVLLKDKPPEMTRLSPKNTVPVLRCSGGMVLDESLDIMLWALEQRDLDSWLEDNSWKKLVAENDGPFKQSLDRYKYFTNHPERTREEYRADGEVFLQCLEDQLNANNGKGLLRHSISFADIAIFPFIRQFANSDRVWFDAAPYPLLRDWLEQLIHGEQFLSIMRKRKPWQAGDEPLIETWAPVSE